MGTVMSIRQYQFDDHDLDSMSRVVAGFGQDRYGYVVTPNVDHLIRLHDEPTLQPLYADAAYAPLDSRFLALLLRALRGIRLRVCTGSDLTGRLLSELVQPEDRLLLIGCEPAQAQQLRLRYGLQRLQHYNPPMGFIHDPRAVDDCLAFIEARSPFRYCLLAVGSPQQELLAHQLQGRGIARGLALCIGASINFLTGSERRAPRWMQRCGLEWLYRLLQDPARLAHRYLVRGPRIFRLLRRAEIAARPAAASGA